MAAFSAASFLSCSSLAISSSYGTTVNNICRMNNIKSTTVLRIGRSLRVR